MAKSFHEFRDPIHVFIKLGSPERKVVDSRPFQRLRHIHQLALTYLVYPGATHSRFEHSLGVMELAGRIFDVITDPSNLSPDAKHALPELDEELGRQHWRRSVRMAALFHDVGHLPFSHAAEHELLPEGWDHERLSLEIIRSDEMKQVWRELHVDADEIAKLALGPKKALRFGLQCNDVETILAEIITGNAFGADRMDYLLRDSYHTGVAYGRFDHFRLIDTLRILTPPPVDGDGEQSREPTLGVEHGGLQSAEALLLARYFMFTQVYFHRVRRIYDIHLCEFLKEWLSDGRFSIDLDSHLSLTDNEVLSAMRAAAANPKQAGHATANRILTRGHFRVAYEFNPYDATRSAEAAQRIFKALCDEFGRENVRSDTLKGKSSVDDFPVQMMDGGIASAISLSSVLGNLPNLHGDYVFVTPERHKEAKAWIARNQNDLLAS